MLLALLMLAGCGRAALPPAKPVVMVSVPPLAFFVEQIAGDRVTVEVMIPPGANPATYEPTIQQMQALSKASLYVKVGHPHFPFERAWLDRLLLPHPGLEVVDASARITRQEGDPHVWVSPGCVRLMAEDLHQALARILPDHQPVLAARREQFINAIDALDEQIRLLLGDQGGHKFLVFHPAWGCFAHEYGLVQIAIEQDARKPTPAQLAALIDLARSEGIRVILVQPQFSRRSAEIVAAEIGGRVVAIDPLDRDWFNNLRRVAEAFREALRP